MKEENMDEFKFNSAICTSREQSESLLALGLKKETADMCHRTNGMGIYFVTALNPLHNPCDIPAWSLHRLIEILDTNPCVFYTNCGYDNIIDRIEDYIKEGIIDTRYLEEWCLNEEE